MTARLPASEAARLKTLRGLKVLDTLPEEDLDGIVELARALLDVPIALVSLIDEDRQWFKAKAGLDVCETSRDLAFCAHAILQTEPLVVPDATCDPRFADNPLVTGEFGLRFYAGAPIVIDGQAVGTVCCIDPVPRTPTPRQVQSLVALARQAGALLVARRRAAEFEESERRFVAFLDHSPALAFLKDHEGRMRFSNQRHASVFGYEPGSILGLRDEDRMPPSYAENLRRHDEEVRRAGTAVERDEIVPLPDGTLLTWHVLKFPLEIEGETWVGGMAIDVTAQREAEALARSQAEELARALDTAQLATEAARHAAIRFEQLFDGLPVACFTYDAEGTIYEWNAEAEALWGVSYAESFQASIYDVVVGEAHREAERETVRRVFAGEAVMGAERFETMRDGSVRWILTNTFPLRNAVGEVVGAVSANVDMTERKRMETEIRESEARFRTVVESLHEGLVVQDADGRIVLWNESTEQILGLTADQLAGRTSLDPSWRTVHEDGSPFPGAEHPIVRALATGERQPTGVMGVSRPDGGMRWISVNAAPMLPDGSGRPISAVASFMDVTERLEQERFIHEQMAQISSYSAELEMQKHELESANSRLEGLATTDGLTGLRNHRFFQDFLRKKIEQCGGAGLPISVVLLDVDRFKNYNDDFGHQAGDAVLRGVAGVLERSVRDRDLAARYGGEEFVLVLPGLDAEGAAAVAERARKNLEGTAFEWRAVTASFGVASFGPGTADAESMIQAADEAMYRSKEAGRNRVTRASGAVPVAV